MNSVKGNCAVCDGEITLTQDTHVSEVVSCNDCKSRLVVDSVAGDKATLSKAPEVEEDWGE